MPIPHAERIWASNGFDRYRTPPRRRLRGTLLLALLMIWGWLGIYGAAVLIGGR